ncbi:sensor histidine kinase [Oculatella sp. LEGE 06141]|uniref:sensor histidine kinase n=1 Tax=Oculatella sp. LEGE 06141 TaxID=1828648 RepID=UPI001D1393C2|nr:HAMP domain-containing sensor histidine kinase [Oculatella sp. LEGE 06141]
MQRRFRHSQQTAKPQANATYVQPVSLRVKLLVGFSIVFSFVFAGAFYWFYTFATDKIMTQLRSDMQATLAGAVQGVDVEELLALYRNGDRNAAGFSDDPRYQNQLAWFKTIHSIEPRVWLYSFVINESTRNRRVGAAAVAPGELEVVYLVDLWSLRNPTKAAKFLEAEAPGTPIVRVFEENRVVETPLIYRDRWGKWLSAFAPLHDTNGRVVAVLGLDIEADYVFEVREAIRNRVIVAFVTTYGVLFVLIYFLSGALTQQLTDLTESAARIGAGDYNLNLALVSKSKFPDEMDLLAQVFEAMVDGIRTRERLIREGKRAEDEMRLALQEERELNELKSRFVSMVSHELRTPLTVIKTSLELLDRYGDVASEDKKRDYFKRGRSAVENMTQLLEDVLTLSKADAGKLECKPSVLNLEMFCEEVVEEVQMGGASHNIVFSTQANCEDAYLDRTLLRWILTNLLSNAVKYSPIGSTIELKLTCLDDTAIFEVRDRGIGIPLDDQPRLFELFHRASNATAIRGTGLGLAIVKQCVALHQGYITFTSEEGMGTTFKVGLPLRQTSLTA